ncbi:photosystem I assembly protein Ycf3 [Rubripirellula tenax]|uniref:Photosystem I assembly protein Ycf3 n=1 Tax=Rubripirellula tenax TaxID=2528015 RepID=A0A5C6FCR7_9BACT|nr:tetratricopeptide repeat protein [Rubripirellula tenax]TWU58427.1 photosystem I assembly protein Ycf3 [Rubripirellula tenax]
MKRLSRGWLCDVGAGVLITCTMVGCASWKNGNETIIQVQSAQNPVRARKQTAAGVKALGHDNIDEAAEKFMSAIQADETYGPAHNNLGLLHFEQGNLYQAVLAFEQAMEFMPNDPIVYYNLALTLESAGKVSEALDLYVQAVQMAPANPVFLGNLVRLRIRLGESGFDLNEQLKDLVLIETRPEWRRWADRQLGLFFNDTLDRGPETPDFDGGKDDESDEAIEFRIEDRIIDLTPKSRPEVSIPTDEPNFRERSAPRVPSKRIPATQTLLPPSNEIPPPPPEPIPSISIPDPASFDMIPPSIEAMPSPRFE